jgi:hypothetical protein
VLLILVGGFGLLARTGGMANGLPGWLHPKLLIWVLVGGLPALINRKPEWGKLLWFIVPLLMLTAAYFGVYHPGQSTSADDEAQTKADAKADDKADED